MIFRLTDRPVIDQMLKIELVPTSHSFAQTPGLCLPCPIVGCAYVLAAIALLFAAPSSCRQLFPPYHLPILDCFTLSCCALKKISHKPRVNQHMQSIYLWRTEQFLVLSMQANSLCQFPKVSGAILLSAILLHLTINNQALWSGVLLDISNLVAKVNLIGCHGHISSIFLLRSLIASVVWQSTMIDCCVPSSPALSSTSVCFTGIQICIHLSYPK